MNVGHIEIKNHIEVGLSGMPERRPYLYVNGVRLCHLEPDELQPAVNIMRRVSQQALSGDVKFQLSPELAV
jgi:hypothetical protein